MLLRIGCSAFALFVVAASLPTAFAQGPVQPIVVHTPAPRAFDLALGELWLRGSAQEQRTPPRLPQGNMRHVATRAGHALLATDNTSTVEQLVSQVRQLEDANPQSEAYLVLYERGSAHDDAHRSLLTKEVVIILNQGAKVPQAAQALGPTPAGAIPNAFVVRAADPFGALELAEQLRAEPGVQTSYPLLKRVGVPR